MRHGHFFYDFLFFFNSIKQSIECKHNPHFMTFHPTKMKLFLTWFSHLSGSTQIVEWWMNDGALGEVLILRWEFLAQIIWHQIVLVSLFMRLIGQTSTYSSECIGKGAWVLLVKVGDVSSLNRLLKAPALRCNRCFLWKFVFHRLQQEVQMCVGSWSTWLAAESLKKEWQTRSGLHMFDRPSCRKTPH